MIVRESSALIDGSFLSLLDYPLIYIQEFLCCVGVGVISAMAVIVLVLAVLLLVVMLVGKFSDVVECSDVKADAGTGAD